MNKEEIISNLLEQNKVLSEQNKVLSEQNKVLSEQNKVLMNRVSELERRLSLNSTNSSKPPSSDGLKKPPSNKTTSAHPDKDTIEPPGEESTEHPDEKPTERRTRSLRGVSKRKSGGQKGHPGETLHQTSTPDVVINHFPENCSHCGSLIETDTSTGYQARQVFDLPEPKPLEVTEHRAHNCQCHQCGHQTRADFPQDVTAPAQYGARIGAIIVYLLSFQFLTEERLVLLMKDLFGVVLSSATVANISHNCAQRFQGVVDLIGQLIKVAVVKHLDETGFRVGGKTQWLHIASTNILTFYRISAKRGDMLADVIGTIVHDHWKPYYTMQNVLHALCNAHHLRELKALIEIEKEQWASKLQKLLRLACHFTNLARERGQPLREHQIARIERCYDAIVAEGLAFHEAHPLCAPSHAGQCGRKKHRIGHNLLLRLQSRKEDVLRFLRDPSVPFTNNQAEQDGRMMKLRQKISGGFRSLQGAEDFTIIRSLISTARKQGLNVIHTLMQDPHNLIMQLRIA